MSKLRKLLRGLIAEEVLLSEGKITARFDDLTIGSKIHYTGAEYQIMRKEREMITMKKISITKGIGAMYQPKAKLDSRNYESQVKMGFIKKVDIYK